jgi:DNA-directed RNA polymerase subunit L
VGEFVELKKLKEDNNTLLVEVGQETLTVTNALREELWNDKNVIEAAQIKEHPYLAQPKVFVKTDKGSPAVALEKAAERVSAQAKEFREEFKKAAKK